MKVLLTGANGFVGSHILDALRAAGHDAAVLLRRTSDTRFIDAHLPHVEAHYGSLEDADSLRAAVEDAEAVVHCAGKTKALRAADYFAVNGQGARNLAEAAAAAGPRVGHMVLISSLAATGPGDPARPAREDDPPAPVSVYGRSKLAGETAWRGACKQPWTVLRPAAVYGPRDKDFLAAFRAARAGFLPLFGRGRQPLSLVHARDVAAAVCACLGRGEAFGKTYHVAAEPPCTSAELFREIARQMGRRLKTIPLPLAALWPVCAAYDLAARVRRRPHILSLYKWPELRARGWVCSVERIRADLGFEAQVSLSDGLRETLAWYREQGWLP